MSILPPIVIELSERIIGEQCTQSLLLSLNYNDTDCIKYAISKGLGIGIVVGGSIMKLPQIIAILSAQSAEGLSYASSILSTLSYLTTTAYGYRSEFPFSTYGENLFLSIQDTLVSLLIVFYTSHMAAKTSMMLLSLSTVIGASAYLINADLRTLSMLQVATIPLSIGSKVPQIVANWRNKSTGQLSGVVVWIQVFGTIARLFTSLQEINDMKIMASFGAALLLNLVLAIQIMFYKPGTATSSSTKSREEKKSDSGALPEKGPINSGNGRPSTPTLGVGRPGTPTGSAGKAGGKKWARKMAD